MNCSRCQRVIPSEAETWPGGIERDAVLCQECWEAQCSDEWWSYVNRINEGLIATPCPGCHAKAGVPLADSAGMPAGGLTAGETANGFLNRRP